MTKHMMVDCETLGLAPGCVILSVGAVTWDDQVEGLGLSDYWRVDVLSSLAAGLRVEPKTVAWWQEPEQVGALGRLLEEQVGTLDAMLLGLYELYQRREVQRVWSNGPAADVTWLEAAYRARLLDPPWSFRDVRCCRTVLELAGVGREERTQPTVSHHALVDAVAQATDVRVALRRLASGPSARV